MLSNAGANADLVWIEPRAEFRDRNAARVLVWLDHRSFVKGSLLHFAGHHGCFDVPGVKDDADDVNRSAATDDDEVHAPDFCRDVYRVSDIERAGGLYFDEQPGRHRAAVVLEPHASGDCAGESKERQEILKANISFVKRLETVI